MGGAGSTVGQHLRGELLGGPAEPFLPDLPAAFAVEHETGEALVAGAEPGAPTRPRLGLKLAVATGAAVVLWLVLYGLVLLKVVDL